MDDSHRSRIGLGTSLALGLVVLSAFAAPRPSAVLFGTHKDARIGFSIQTPVQWTAVPIAGDDRWMVGKYLADKSSFWTEKGGGWTYEHRPDMEMIAFVDAKVVEKAKLVAKEKRDGRSQFIVEFDSPYKNYKDFLGRRYKGGGWFVQEEKEDKVNGVPVTCYDIRVDKQSQTGPKVIAAWVYHIEDVDLAVQFESLADTWPKLSAETLKCLRSFKPVQRSGAGLVEASTGDGTLVFVDEDTLTPEERRNRRGVLEKSAHDRATAKLTEGWTVKKMGHFLVFNHADEKYAKRLVEQAEAAWKWLDETFGFVGEGEYVRTPILRICKDEPEYVGFFRGQDWYSESDLEIVTYQDNDGSTSWEFGWVNRLVLRFWIFDKNRTLALGMPGWLRAGLLNLVENLHLKSGKVTFKRDEWNRDDVRQAARDSKTSSAKELLVLAGEAYWHDYLKIQEASQLVDFLAARGGAKDRRTKDLLPEYMKNLQAVVAQVEKESAPKDDEEKPKTEAEEDAWFKKKRQSFKEKEQRILQETFDRTFGTWKESDWKAFEDAYVKAAR